MDDLVQAVSIAQTSSVATHGRGGETAPLNARAWNKQGGAPPGGSPLSQQTTRKLMVRAKDAKYAVQARQSGNAKCGDCRAWLVVALTMEVRGFPLGRFLGLLGGLVLPTLDWATDWGMILQWHQQGHENWRDAGLGIMPFSAGAAWQLLTLMLVDSMGFGKALGVSFPLAISGLAPVALTAWVLRKPTHEDSHLELILAMKGAEMMFEAVPQSMLQTYVGVAYGKFDPQNEEFSLLLPCSVLRVHLCGRRRRDGILDRDARSRRHLNRDAVRGDHGALSRDAADGDHLRGHDELLRVQVRRDNLPPRLYAAVHVCAR